jgi:hypothetical protein
MGSAEEVGTRGRRDAVLFKLADLVGQDLSQAQND